MFETYEDMVTIDDVCQMLNIGKNNACCFENTTTCEKEKYNG